MVKMGNELLEMCKKKRQSHLVDKSRKNFCSKEVQKDKILQHTGDVDKAIVKMVRTLCQLFFIAWL